MAKKSNTLLYLGLAVAGLFIIPKIFGSPAPTPNPKPKPDPSPPNDNGNSGSYPIKYMYYHPDVKELQAALELAQDGKIGPNTSNALREYDIQFGRLNIIPNRAILDSYIAKILLHKSLQNNDGGGIFTGSSSYSGGGSSSGANDCNGNSRCLEVQNKSIGHIC